MRTAIARVLLLVAGFNLAYVAMKWLALILSKTEVEFANLADVILMLLAGLAGTSAAVEIEKTEFTSLPNTIRYYFLVVAAANILVLIFWIWNIKVPRIG